MSTRCSIWYSKEPLDIHIYSECFDDTVWIEICNGPSTTTFQIPQEAMKAILESETCREYARNGPSEWFK